MQFRTLPTKEVSSESSVSKQLATFKGKAPVMVQVDDFVYKRGWNAAPVVIESHKLIFFTVQKAGCTVFKQLFRRMMGKKDWKSRRNPADVKTNGLKYLFDYSIAEATELMNSPDYTRAIFVRDPKEKFLSAFLDKAMRHKGQYMKEHCCGSGRGGKACVEKVRTFQGFIEKTRECKDSHWGPQSERMEATYFPLLDFVGHLESAEEDARELLKRVGAWEEFGKTGWGVHHNESIFQSTSAVRHSTSNGTMESKSRLPLYYTPELEAEIEERLSQDYLIPELGLQKKKIDYS
jgi:hypothetical protein